MVCDLFLGLLFLLSLLGQPLPLLLDDGHLKLDVVPRVEDVILTSSQRLLRIGSIVDVLGVLFNLVELHRVV